MRDQILTTQSSHRVLVGYDRCGQPIFRYVTQNRRSNSKYSHNQKFQAPIRKGAQQRANSQYRY